MKVLITGVQGFLGRNACLFLSTKGYEILPFDKENTLDELRKDVALCDAVLHFAGVNRPKNIEEFQQGNADFTATLLSFLSAEHRPIPFFFSSSIQASKDNPYGQSKHVAEEEVFSYGKATGSRIAVYRFPNLYGPGSRPFYNSVIATWCYQIARGEEIQINPEDPQVPFGYVFDVCLEVEAFLKGETPSSFSPLSLSVIDVRRLSEVASLLKRFAAIPKTGEVPLQEGFEKKLYATFLTYKDPEQLSYPLDLKSDERGFFSEFLRLGNQGQISLNLSHPGISKGNHYHTTKNEKFLVVSGTCRICLRKVGEEKVVSYLVDGEKPTVVDIPPLWAHSITNVGEADSITLMWANEPFDPENPDTYFEKVEK